MFCLFFVLIQGFLIKVVCRRVRSGMSLSRRHHKAVTCDLRTSVRTAFIIYTSVGVGISDLDGAASRSVFSCLSKSHKTGTC